MTEIPIDPLVKPKHYVDGLVSIPQDLVRDPSLTPTDKTLALAIASLCFRAFTEIMATNTDLEAACGMTDHQIRASMRRLEAAGLIARSIDPNEGKHRKRRIILCWKLPDELFGGPPAETGGER